MAAVRLSVSDCSFLGRLLREEAAKVPAGALVWSDVLALGCQLFASFSATFEQAHCESAYSEQIIQTTVELLGRIQQHDEAVDDQVAALSVCLIRAIANCCFRHKGAQDEVRELGGITLLLNSCQMCEAHPYRREFAILALRNVTEGNTANQELIRSMRMQGTVQSQELEEIGLEMKVSEEGKVSVQTKAGGRSMDAIN